ncbi:MAG TPA: hypothetical protein VEW07_11410 [Solirubrobacterales bacterium]|nr:hypothetical protein [Solirubrobacterales bacterium]
MQINIAPDEKGRWNWERVEDGGAVTEGPGFDDRSEAIAAGRAEGGAEEVTVTRGGGDPETYFTPPTCRVVLLRADRSEVGELDSAPGDGSVGQSITLTPVTEDGESVDLEEADRG